MNPLFKFLPLAMNSKLLAKNKKWLAVALLIFSGYQLFSPNGVGADWGIPSVDSLYREPRDLLINRVEAARDAQQETAEEFESALEKFKAVTGFEGGDLKDKFNTLNSAFKDSEAAAERVSRRIDRVVTATNNLLAEWRAELDEYNDAAIKQRAQQQFDITRAQSARLIAAMRRAEQKTQPVLAAFRDQVLFVKHNLNMQAISSLQQETVIIEEDVSALIAEMEASIAEAEAFIASIRT